MCENFIEWSDNRKPFLLGTILSFVSLSWLTKSFGSAMWAYRQFVSSIGGPTPTFPLSLTKLFGFPSFAVEMEALPRAWAEVLFPNLVLYRSHDVVSLYLVRNEGIDTDSHVVQVGKPLCRAGRTGVVLGRCRRIPAQGDYSVYG